MKTCRIRWISGMIFLIVTIDLASAQFGVSIGGGAADIIFLQAGQSPYLGYENNSLIHNFPLVSFQAGIIRQTDLSNRFAANLGFLYAMQGLDYSTSFLHDRYGFRLLISYIKLPILLKIKTNLDQNKNSGLLLGPYISTSLGATKSVCIADIKTKSTVENVRSIDAGCVIGYSWDLGRNPNHLYIDLRGSYSLRDMMDVLDGPSKYYGPEEKLARNISIIVALEYMLN